MARLYGRQVLEKINKAFVTKDGIDLVIGSIPSNLLPRGSCMRSIILYPHGGDYRQQDLQLFFGQLGEEGDDP